MANKIDDLLNCDCDVCEYRHYINTNDCDIHRKKEIKSALYKVIKGRIIRIKGRWLEGDVGNGLEWFISKAGVLSAIKEIFDA